MPAVAGKVKVTFLSRLLSKPSTKPVPENPGRLVTIVTPARVALSASRLIVAVWAKAEAAAKRMKARGRGQAFIGAEKATAG